MDDDSNSLRSNIFENLSYPKSGLSTHFSSDEKQKLMELDSLFKGQFRDKLEKMGDHNEAIKLFKESFVTSRNSPKSSIEFGVYNSKLKNLGYRLFNGHSYADDDKDNSYNKLRFIVKLESNGTITGVSIDPKKKSTISFM